MSPLAPTGAAPGAISTAPGSVIVEPRQLERMLQHLQQQMAELEERETALHRQAGKLREIQLSSQQKHSELVEIQRILDEREAVLQRRERELVEVETAVLKWKERLEAETLAQQAARQTEFEQELAARAEIFQQELQQQAAEHADRLAQAEAEQAERLQAAAAEQAARWTQREAELSSRENLLAGQAAALAEQQAEFERGQAAGLEQLALQEEQLRQQLADTLESERQTLTLQLQQELSAAHADLGARQAEWLAFETQAREQLEQEQQKLTTALNELEEQRQSLAAELATARSQAEQQLAELTEQLAAEKALHIAQLTSLQAEQARAASALEQLQLEREQLERQCQQLGVQTAQEYAERQQKVAAELEQLRKDKLAALDLREQELSQREINTEKRFRFHEQHLERLRQSLQAAQSEHEQQRQQDRLWAMQVEETIRLRLAHMQRFRDLLSQRETLLEKEQERFATVRREAEQELLDRREALLYEQSVWEQERDATRQFFTAERERLLSVSAQLDQEQVYLSQLRTELEASLQQTVELKVAVDDAWAHYAHAGEAVKSAEILHRARRQFADHLRDVTTFLSQERESLASSCSELQAIRQTFATEEVQLNQWLTAREAQLGERELALQKAYAQLAHEYACWRADRDTWQQDREAAEGVIRQLVQQLEQALRDIAILQSELGSSGTGSAPEPTAC
jgi:hypothetical protein